MKKILIFLFLISPLYARTNQQLGADSNTVLLVHLNYGSGTTAYDVSGNGNNGTITAALWTNELFDKSLDFDGSSAYVQLANESSFDFEYNDKFSISFWALAKSTGTNLFTVTKELNAAPNTGYYIFWRWVTDSFRLQFNLENENTAPTVIAVYGNTPMLANKWYFCVGTYNGNSLASGVELYVNGIKQEKTILYDTLGNNSILNDVPLQISGRQGANLCFNGKIDEVAVYRGVLSAGEIQHIYNSQSGRFQ